LGAFAVAAMQIPAVAQEDVGPAREGEPSALEATTNQVFTLDLATALRLAGAQSLDVLIARERVSEARARHDQARQKFFPWLSPGIGYRRHEGNIQDVAGAIFNADKQSYTVGAGLNAQLDLGEAIYQSLAARQTSLAVAAGAEARRQEAVQAAATGYFDLLRTQAAAGVAREAVRLNEQLTGQFREAVGAGLVFRGDLFRAEVQTRKSEVQVRRFEEERRAAAARLAQVLRLDPSVDLVPAGPELVPLELAEAGTGLSGLIAQALAARPELRQAAAVAEAAGAERRGTTVGPWIPTLGAQAGISGLGGGRDEAWGDFDDARDYQIGLSWRLGPGGLFDRPRVRAAQAREQAMRLEAEKSSDEVVRQVVEIHNRIQSLRDQLKLTERAMESAGELFQLSRSRREYGVGVVLEAIQAEQELTQARLEHLRVVAAYNQAQYLLRRAVGTP